MKAFFVYWLWPNPGGWHYGDSRVQVLLWVLVLLIVLSFVLRFLRKQMQNPQTKSLTKSWPTVLLWFGIAGLFLLASRVEMIQFLAMRALWLVWGILLALFIAVQLLQFRRRHYAILGRTTVIDEREKYLPKRK